MREVTNVRREECPRSGRSYYLHYFKNGSRVFKINGKNSGCWRGYHQI